MSINESIKKEKEKNVKKKAELIRVLDVVENYIEKNQKTRVDLWNYFKNEGLEELNHLQVIKVKLSEMNKK